MSGHNASGSNPEINTSGTTDHKVPTATTPLGKDKNQDAGLTVDDLEDVLLELNNYEKQVISLHLQKCPITSIFLRVQAKF